MNSSLGLLPTERISRVFGWREFPHALFYQAQFALRFELAEGIREEPLCFLQAIDRARELASAAFADSEKLTAVVSYYEGERRTSKSTASFRTLREMGFKADFGPAEKGSPDDEQSDRYRYWHVADFRNEPGQINILLWASIARELPVSPKPRSLTEIYIVDLERGIAMLAYDDRGADIIAIDRAPLQALYERYSHWLLEYDRLKIDATFSQALS